MALRHCPKVRTMRQRRDRGLDSRTGGCPMARRFTTAWEVGSRYFGSTTTPTYLYLLRSPLLVMYRSPCSTYATKRSLASMAPPCSWSGRTSMWPGGECLLIGQEQKLSSTRPVGSEHQATTVWLSQ